MKKELKEIFNDPKILYTAAAVLSIMFIGACADIYTNINKDDHSFGDLDWDGDIDLDDEVNHSECEMNMESNLNCETYAADNCRGFGWFRD